VTLPGGYTRQEEGVAPPRAAQRSDVKDLLGALLLLAVSVTFAVASLRIPFTSQSWEWYTAPGVFALAMATCLAVCSLAVGYRGLRGWLKGREAAAAADWRDALRAWGIGRFLGSVGVILGYLFLLGKIPFLLASGALILIFGAGFRGRDFLTGLKPATIAALIIAAFSFVIMKVFGILFP
jgi:hypothetical protein